MVVVAYDEDERDWTGRVDLGKAAEKKTIQQVIHRCEDGGVRGWLATVHLFVSESWSDPAGDPV